MKLKINDMVVTGDPKCCHSGNKRGTVGRIMVFLPPYYGVEKTVYGVINKQGSWFVHCDKCLEKIKEVKK